MCRIAVAHLMSHAGLTRIMLFLSRNEQFDHSKNQICENACISGKYFDEMAPILIQMGIIKITRRLCGNIMYKIDAESRVVGAIHHFERDVDYFIKNPRPLPNLKEME